MSSHWPPVVERKEESPVVKRASIWRVIVNAVLFVLREAFAIIWNLAISIIVGIIKALAVTILYLVSYFKKIDENAKCPGCGHRCGKIEFTHVVPTNGDADRGKIKHTCLVCGAQWFKKTVLDAEKWVAKIDYSALEGKPSATKG